MEGSCHSLCRETSLSRVLAMVTHGLASPNPLKEGWEHRVVNDSRLGIS